MNQPCGLKISKYCKGKAEVYSGLAGRVICEKCQRLLIKRHQKGELKKSWGAS